MAKKTIADLNIKFSATTAKFSRDTKSASSQIAAFTARARQAATGLLAIAAAAAALRPAINVARSFGQSMANSTAIMADATGEVRKQMEAVAKTVSGEFKFSASEAAEAYYFLASAGMSAAQAMAALPQVAAFAQAGNFDLATATDLATDAQSALGLASKDAAKNQEGLARVTDVLIKANTLANASAQQFSESLTNKAGAALRQLGKGVEEGVAVLAAFADQGVKGAESGTALAIVLRDLSTKAINFKSQFAAAGVSVFDSAGEMRNAADIVADLEQTLAGLSDQAAKQKLLGLGFSDKSLGFIMTLLGTSGKIRAYQAQLAEASGITGEIAKKQIPEFDRALNKLSATFQALSINALTPVLNLLGKGLNSALEFLGTSLGRDITRMTVFASMFAAVAVVIPKVVAAIRSVVSALKAMAVGQSIVASLSGPKGWAQLAIAAGVAAGATAMVSDAFAGLADDADKAKQATTATAKSMQSIGPAAAAQAAQLQKVESGYKGMVEAARELQRQADEVSERGKQVAESLRTPREIYKDTIDELKALKSAGAITGSTLARGTSRAKEDLESALGTAKDIRDTMNPPSVGALTKGTRKAFEAMLAANSATQRITGANVPLRGPKIAKQIQQAEQVKALPSSEAARAKRFDLKAAGSDASRRLAQANDKLQQLIRKDAIKVTRRAI